jgi:hypothetical protein
MSRSARALFKYVQYGTCRIARPNSSRPKSYLFRHTGDMAQMQAREAV